MVQVEVVLVRVINMRKGYWYLSGFESYGLKYRAIAFVAKILYLFHLISDEDCKRLADVMINSWLVEQAKKHNLRIDRVEY